MNDKVSDEVKGPVRLLASAATIMVNGAEVARDYGDVMAEYKALTETAGVLDLSFRSRICLTGTDRIGFLHGQVTNDVKGLSPSNGCYAALSTAKGRMQSDLNIYRLADELLLDFEPGLTQTVAQRLEKYIISEDVQITDVGEAYGLLSVQGPKAGEVLLNAEKAILAKLPEKPLSFVSVAAAEGEIYIINRSRFGSGGYDVFLPAVLVALFKEKFVSAVSSLDGRLCGWEATEIARVEAGIPRFGADMDETNIPLEAELEKSAISFNKGCYIGQEVISRIRTYSEVTKALRGLRLAEGLKALPVKGEKLYKEAREVGYITSAVRSPRLNANIALGYVRKETNQIGAELTWRSEGGESAARIVEVPFV